MNLLVLMIDEFFTSLFIILFSIFHLVFFSCDLYPAIFCLLSYFRTHFINLNLPFIYLNIYQPFWLSYNYLRCSTFLMFCLQSQSFLFVFKVHTHCFIVYHFLLTSVFTAVSISPHFAAFSAIIGCSCECDRCGSVICIKVLNLAPI